MISAATGKPPGAYPYPFGSSTLGGVEALTDVELQRLPLPRLRDQAVSVDQVFAEFKGAYLALHKVGQQQGLTPYLAAQLTRTADALRRIQVQQRRVRALLDAAPQPRQPGRN